MSIALALRAAHDGTAPGSDEEGWFDLSPEASAQIAAYMDETSPFRRAGIRNIDLPTDWPDGDDEAALTAWLRATLTRGEVADADRALWSLWLEMLEERRRLRAAWEAAEVSAGRLKFLTAHKLTAWLPVSRVLVESAEPAVADRVIAQDVGEVMGLRETLSFVAGTGVSGQPLGAINTAGIRTRDEPNPTVEKLLTEARRVRGFDTKANVAAFVSPAFALWLEMQEGSDRWLYESDDRMRGVIHGELPFFVSTQMPTVNASRRFNGGAVEAWEVERVVIGNLDAARVGRSPIVQARLADALGLPVPLPSAPDVYDLDHAWFRLSHGFVILNPAHWLLWHARVGVAVALR